MSQEKPRRKTREKGISLVEVLIGMLISTVIVLAILMFFSSSQKAFFNQGNRSDAVADSNFPGTWISRDIRGATQVVAAHNGHSTSQNVLVLMVPAITNIEMPIEGSFDYIIYRRSPDSTNMLERIIDAADGVSSRTDGSRIVADDLSSINFFYYDENNQVTADYASAVSINFSIASSKVSYQRGAEPFVESYNSWAKLRNKSS